MKAAMRALKNHALSYSDVEVKMREATSNDPWSCPLSLMRELSRATHDYVDYPKLFAMLWKRLADVEHAMHVTKALQLLDFLIRHGSERFVLDVKRRQRDIAALQRYKHYSESGQDESKEARAKAKQIYELLANDAQLQTERQAAELQRTASDRGDSYHLTADEKTEQELYRARTREQRAQRHREADDDELSGGSRGRRGEEDEDGHGSGGRGKQQPAALHSTAKRGNRGRQAGEEESEEAYELAEEKRHSAADERRSGRSNNTAAATARRPKAAGQRAAHASSKGAAAEASFDPVSEEEMEDEAVDGTQQRQQQQRSSRVTTRTVRRKTTSSSVREPEGDEVTEQEAEEESVVHAQQSSVSDTIAHSQHQHAPNQSASPLDETASVTRKQSSVSGDGSSASSAYSLVAESPIPLVDDLLSQPAVQSSHGSSSRPQQQQQRAQRNGSAALTASVSLPASRSSQRASAAVSYAGEGDVGDEVDIPSVADELDLLSLAAQPNVYFIPAAAQRSAEIDILTGTPVLMEDRQSTPAAASHSGAGRTQRGGRPPLSAPLSLSHAASAVTRAPSVTPANPAHTSSSASPSGRRSVQSHSQSQSQSPSASPSLTSSQPPAAAAVRSSAVSAKKAALLAQLAALEQEDSAPLEAEHSPHYNDGNEQQQQQQQQQQAGSAAQATRSGGVAERAVRRADVAQSPQPRRSAQTAQQQQAPLYNEEEGAELGDEEEESVDALYSQRQRQQQRQYDEPALLDTLPAASATRSSPVSAKPNRAGLSSAPRKASSTVAAAAAMSDVWNDSGLTDLDHLASSSRLGLPPASAQRAVKGSSMAEMQRAAPFPSASSVASSMLDDEALQSAFARKAPATVNQLGMVGGKQLSAAARRKPAPASTDIFFQS